MISVDDTPTVTRASRPLPASLTRRFVAGLFAGEGSVIDGPASSQLERHLESLVRAAEAAHPSFAFSRDLFVDALARRARAEADPLELLSQLRAADLYLVCAWLHGDAAALGPVDALICDEARHAVQRLRNARVAVDELTQELRELLLVSRPDQPSPLANYSGRGQLRSWIRVLAFRTALRSARRRVEDPAPVEALLDALPEDPVSPELRYLKQTYRVQFREALHGALGELDGRQRNLLRFQLLDGLSIDDLGAMYRVHRATAARWLVQARHKLLEGTRDRLMATLRVGPQEFESIMRLLHSQLDVSLERFLGPDGDGAGERRDGFSRELDGPSRG